MPHRLALLFLFIVATLSLGAAREGTSTQEAADAETIKLEQEVDALSALNTLHLTSEQVTQLKGMISDTAGALSDPPTPIDSDYRAALKELRAALLSKDESKIASAQDKADSLEDKQDPDSDAGADQSDGAKEKAVTLLKMLSVKQVADFIGEHSDDMDDPTKVLLDAVHHARDASDDDFESLRDDTAERVGVFFGIARPGKPLQILMKVKKLLTKVHHLSPEDYQSQQSALEDEARQMINATDPIPFVRHWMENQMADLLSNPQLGQALSETSSK